MPHLDEGTIHAWLDGALSSAEARAVEAHVASCVSCAAAVAEARGLIAATSRILAALDDVPGGVIPAAPEVDGASDSARDVVQLDARTRRTSLWRSPVLRAAAVIVVGFAGTMWITREQRASRQEVASPASAPQDAASGATARTTVPKDTAMEPGASVAAAPKTPDADVSVSRAAPATASTAASAATRPMAGSMGGATARAKSVPTPAPSALADAAPATAERRSEAAADRAGVPPAAPPPMAALSAPTQPPREAMKAARSNVQGMEKFGDNIVVTGTALGYAKPPYVILSRLECAEVVITQYRLTPVPPDTLRLVTLVRGDTSATLAAARACAGARWSQLTAPGDRELRWTAPKDVSAYTLRGAGTVGALERARRRLGLEPRPVESVR